MLKDISYIKLEGANFDVSTQLPLFNQNGLNVKVSLLYGRNGSGKSTIAKSFKKIKGEDIPAVVSINLFDNQNSNIMLTSEEKTRIYVYDEDFVNDNVKLRVDGLGAIVMLGEQAKISDQIEVAKIELQEAERNCEQKKNFADEYAKTTSEKSPYFFLNQIYYALQQDNGWAGRKRIIEDLKRNASVTNDTFKEFIVLSPSKARDELIIDFNKELEKLKNAKSGETKITIAVPAVPDRILNYRIDEGNNIIKKNIESPILSDREKYLLELVESGKGEELRITAQEFTNPDLKICPKCHQQISENYKANLIQSISRVLSQEVKEHQSQLKGVLLQELEMDLSPFLGLSHYQACIDLVEGLNKRIVFNNSLLQKKLDNPYKEIDEDLLSIADLRNSLLSELKQLESDRENHNKKVTDIQSIKKELTRINNEIAYYDVIAYSKKYEEAKKEKEKVDSAYNFAGKIVSEKRRNLNNLKAQLDSIHIAIDVINDCLKYIFFSENRMRIHIENGVYRILCNGHPVKPQDFSVGERNIIGLCYFFTSVLQGKNQKTAYDDEYLLVIDDPVSSYDIENKIGILSFLRYQLGKFLLGNMETKALVMTHDLLTAIDIEKILDELKEEYNVKFSGQKKFEYAPYELFECQIKRFNNKRNEYSELMRIVYEYGNGGVGELDFYIGNIMRQIMEAFSTFEFKKGIEDVSTDDEILSIMKREEERVYYKNLMYRIVLNGGSHKYDQTRNMQTDFFSMISEAEKRRTAREIICFMYLLNKPHVKAHLGECSCSVINSWCESIRNNRLS